MNRLQTSVQIFHQSLAMLKQHRQLLLFPALNLLAVAAVIFVFIIAITIGSTTDFIWADGFLEQLVGNEDGEGESQSFLILALLLPIYLAAMFVATFLNVALYHEILKAFRGGPVSVLGGLRYAVSRSGAVLTWSLMAGLVGAAIQSIGELLGKLGILSSLTSSVAGVAWSVASVFAIPVLIRDEQVYNPVRFLKSSASLIRKTWGEGLIGMVGISAIGLCIFLATIAAGGAVFTASLASESDIATQLGAAFFVLCIAAGVFVLILQFLAKKIFVGGLYTYATEGVVPAPFDGDVFEQAWRVKRTR